MFKLFDCSLDCKMPCLCPVNSRQESSIKRFIPQVSTIYQFWWIKNQGLRIYKSRIYKLQLVRINEFLR